MERKLPEKETLLFRSPIRYPAVTRDALESAPRHCWASARTNHWSFATEM